MIIYKQYTKNKNAIVHKAMDYKGNVNTIGIMVEGPEVPQDTTGILLDALLKENRESFVRWLQKKSKPKPPYLTSYKFYTEKGERLAVFGTPNNKGELAFVHVLRCSKSDQFSKKFARHVIDSYLKDPSGEWPFHLKTIPVANLEYCYRDFLRYCRSAFHQATKVQTEKTIYIKQK